MRRITVSWHPVDNGPAGFYRKLGFRRTGAINHGEVVGELIFDDPPAAELRP